VQGVPTSWDPVIVSMKLSDDVHHTVWSPCSQFIALECYHPTIGVQLLDATTLGRINWLPPQGSESKCLTFSAKSHFLGQLSSGYEEFISWDLQTGAPTNPISVNQKPSYGWGLSVLEEVAERQKGPMSITYSICGTMLGVLYESRGTTTIITYNILSGTKLYSYTVYNLSLHEVWTHGEHLQFATLDKGTITIWEAGFTSSYPAKVLESLPAPSNFDLSKEFLFLPTLSRLAFILGNTVLVWDAQHSKLLLDDKDIKKPRGMTFSSDGHFFACASVGPEIYLWKDSPTGYHLHQKLISHAREHSAPCNPCLSPDGKSLLASIGSILQLWHTADSNISPSVYKQNNEPFLLGFSPDESLAATAQLGDSMAMVLNLKSGVPRLIIDTGMKIYGLRPAGSSVVVVCDGKIITWNLPTQDSFPTTRANINNSVQTIMFDNLLVPQLRLKPFASISPDFNYICIAGVAVEPLIGLKIYDGSSGKCLASAGSPVIEPHFSPDGDKVWCYTVSDELEGWAIVKDNNFGPPKLDHITGQQPEGYPWVPPHGHRILDDGWLVDSGRKRLLWMPPHWRSTKRSRKWSRQFLTFLHHELSEPIILELPTK